jgi:hypothetical protein
VVKAAAAGLLTGKLPEVEVRLEALDGRGLSAQGFELRHF